MALPYVRVNFQDGVTPLNASTLNKVDQGVADLDQAVTGLNTALAGKQSTSEKAQPSGYASLDASGKVPAAQLPAMGTPAVIPVSLSVPTVGAYWTVTTLGAAGWAGGHWEYPDAVSSLVYGSVLVPAGVTAATLRMVLAAPVTGNVRLAAAIASAADGETLAPPSWDILNTAQTVVMPGTAWLRKDATFGLTGLAGRDFLPLAIYRVGADALDTLAGVLGLFGAFLEPA